jgi:hypothetical protein
MRVRRLEAKASKPGEQQKSSKEILRMIHNFARLIDIANE